MRVCLWNYRQRAHWLWLTLVAFAFVTAFYVLRDEYNSYQSRRLLYPGNESLLDLQNFRYRMNSDICQKSDVFLVVFVHSAPAHFFNREAIRKTWGRAVVEGKVVRTVFMTAEIRDTKLQKVLDTESARHGDLVQGMFLDSYRNLTYKHIMGLKWISSECPNAKFTMKMDDDIFVDIFRLVRFLDRRYREGLPTTIGCYLQKGMPVMRDETNKWYVSKNDYPRDFFEDYCSGWAYILSPAVARKLSETSRYFNFFWVDDVYVTGTLAKYAEVKRDPINWIFTISTGSLLKWSRSKDKLAWRYLIGPTWGDIQLMEVAHKKASWCWEKHCECCYPKRYGGEAFPIIPINETLRGKAEMIYSNH